MVLAGLGLFGLPLWGGWLAWRRNSLLGSCWFLRAASLFRAGLGGGARGGSTNNVDLNAERWAMRKRIRPGFAVSLPRLLPRTIRYFRLPE